jgi:hypothetical protein
MAPVNRNKTQWSTRPLHHSSRMASLSKQFYRARL